MIVANYFDIRELVPPHIYRLYGDKSVWFIQSHVLESIELIREHFNKPMSINNWHKGGSLLNRGYRSPYSKVGSKYSQHKLGNAIDFNIKGVSSDDVFEEIIKEFSKFNITTIEDKHFATSWTHIDFRNTFSDDLLIVRPK